MSRPTAYHCLCADAAPLSLPPHAPSLKRRYGRAARRSSGSARPAMLPRGPLADGRGAQPLVERRRVRVGHDEQRRVAQPVRRPLGMLDERPAVAVAHPQRVDVQKVQLDLGGAVGREQIPAADHIVRRQHKRRAGRELCRCDRQLGPALRHERGVVAPVGFGSQRQRRERRGLRMGGRANRGVGAVIGCSSLRMAQAQTGAAPTCVHQISVHHLRSVSLTR